MLRTDVTVEDINEVDVQEVDEVELIEEDEESALEIKNQDQIVEEEKTNLFFFLDENNETISSDQIIQGMLFNFIFIDCTEDERFRIFFLKYLNKLTNFRGH